MGGGGKGTERDRERKRERQRERERWISMLVLAHQMYSLTYNLFETDTNYEEERGRSPHPLLC